MAIPFAMSLMEIAPNWFSKVCNAFGLTYVMALTVSLFNLLAIILSDAYIFHEKNIDETGNGKGSKMCVLFGIVTIYVGSVILHLGPTLIGGEFQYNKAIGNCSFAYGKVQVR